MAYTLTVTCPDPRHPGREPLRLSYPDVKTARQAAQRMKRWAKECEIEVRTPDGDVLRGAQARRARQRRARLGQAMTTKCVQRDRRSGECTEWVLYKRR